MLAMVAHAPNVMVPHRGSGLRRQGADGVPGVSKAGRSRYPRAAGMITTGQLVPRFVNNGAALRRPLRGVALERVGEQ